MAITRRVARHDGTSHGRRHLSIALIVHLSRTPANTGFHDRRRRWGSRQSVWNYRGHVAVNRLENDGGRLLHACE